MTKLDKLFKKCEKCPNINNCLGDDCETYNKQLKLLEEELIKRDTRTQNNE